MPSMTTILRNTRLIAAYNGNAKREEQLDDNVSVWSFSQNSNNSIVNLTFIGKDNTAGIVCAHIKWHNVVVTYAGQNHELDVSDSLFEVFRMSLAAGTIVDSTTYLDGELDRGTLIVCVFKLEQNGGTPKPLSPQEKGILHHDVFMPSWTPTMDKLLCRTATRWPTVKNYLGPTNCETELKRESPMVVVGLELTCFKPKADFLPDPAGANSVEVARFYPHFYICSNVVLDGLIAKIELKRPSETCHTHEKMNKKIKPILITDRNTIPRKVNIPATSLDTNSLLPFWDNLFDYYDADVISKIAGGKTYKLVVVDPCAQTKRSYVVYNIKDTSGSVNKGLFDAQSDYGCNYDRRDGYKVSRQGAYDNIHIAPTMFINNQFMDLHMNNEDLFMAPLCIHDCLHIHWRWGENLGDNRWLKGWSNAGPYTQSGAPMVPLNQKVTLNIRDDAGVHVIYEVAIESSILPESGWQIIMHHGAAYPYDMKTTDRFLASLLAGTSWESFYWRLRYATCYSSPRQLYPSVIERLRWTDKDPPFWGATNFANILAQAKLRDL